MKRFWKVFLITFLSILLLLIITVSIASWLVFTPERLTPIVHKQVEKLITCQSEIGEVDLTFFSTYPNFGLKVKDFALINPVPGAISDTLVKVKELLGIVDADAWRKKKELVLIGLELTGGAINVFSDSLGNTNYDIVVTDTTSAPEKDSETILPVMDIRSVVLDDVNLRYNDLSSKINSVIHDLSTEITGLIKQDNISGKVKLAASGISFEYDGEKYLEQASIKMDIPVDIMASRQFINLKDASITINDLGLELNGTIENDTINQDILTDIDYINCYKCNY